MSRRNACAVPSAGRLRRLARFAAAGVCALALGGPLGPGRAVAQGAGAGVTAGDSLGDAVLPYGPILFDAAVSLARNLVAVTYDARRFDPVTRSFVVSGLKLDRQGFHASADAIRIGAAASSFEGIVVDTRALPLEPPLRDALRRLDSEIVEGSLVASFSGDAPSAGYDLSLAADIRKVGLLRLAAKVDGFHVLLPLGEVASDIESAGAAPDEALDAGAAPPAENAPIVLGTLERASLSFDDRGLAPVLFAIAGEAQNVPPEQFQGAVATMVTPMLASFLAGLPGGAGPALTERSNEWSAVLRGFVATPGHLDLQLTPETPFPLSRLKPGLRVDAALIMALDPRLSNVAGEATALVDPETGTVVGDDRLSLAERLVEGRGVPQDVARGVSLALADVAAGRPEATSVAVRGIGLDPDGAVSDDTAPASYVLLLLAKARGERVPDAALASVRARLPEEAVTAAESRALKEWREGEAGMRGRAAENKAAGARDWAALRRLAFAYYEGVGAPRNVTRAFTLAEVAAAGGDPLAAALRDDLLAAARDGRLAFPVEAGRKAAATLWSKIVTAAAAASQPAPAP